MLRPELVKASRVPLSPDAFSFFGIHDALYFNTTIRRVYNSFLTSVVQRFVNDIASYVRVPLNASDLVAQMKEVGINARYLHLIRLYFERKGSGVASENQ